MNKVYLVCSQANCFSDLDHEVIVRLSNQRSDDVDAFEKLDVLKVK